MPPCSSFVARPLSIVHGGVALASPRGGWRDPGGGASVRCFVWRRAARRAHRGACSPGRSPRPATTAGRRPSMAGWEHTPRCTRRAQRAPGSARKSTAVLPASTATGPRSCLQRSQSPVLHSAGPAEATAAAGIVTAARARPSSLLTFFPNAMMARGPPRPQADVQSRPWMAGGRMWEQDAEISGWASACGRGGPPAPSPTRTLVLAHPRASRRKRRRPATRCFG